VKWQRGSKPIPVSGFAPEPTSSGALTRHSLLSDLVQLGISEKVPIIITYISSLIAGFVVAYVKEWRLALALTVLLPLLTVTGGVMNYFVVPWQQYVHLLSHRLAVLINTVFRGSLNHVADGGGFAEEVISTIRTAQAFGSQRVLSRLYNRHIDRALALDLKTTLVTGIALGVFFFMIYPSYALGELQIF
jgi:ABC-type multidrug transport system, ATPase and permease components